MSMNAFVQRILDKILFPILVLLLAPLITSLTSKLRTGDWFGYLRGLPSFAWILFGVVSGGWFLTSLVLRREKSLRLTGESRAFVTRQPYRWIELGEILYSGVVWKVPAPDYDPCSAELGRIREIEPSSVEANPVPRCPTCKTELEELASFWGGFVWKCARCGFKKKSRDSFQTQAERASKIARRKLEETGGKLC